MLLEVPQMNSPFITIAHLFTLFTLDWLAIWLIINKHLSCYCAWKPQELPSILFFTYIPLKNVMHFLAFMSLNSLCDGYKI